MDINDLPSMGESFWSVCTIILRADDYMEVSFSGGIDELYWDLSGHFKVDNIVAIEMIEALNLSSSEVNILML